MLGNPEEPDIFFWTEEENNKDNWLKGFIQLVSPCAFKLVLYSEDDSPSYFDTEMTNTVFWLLMVVLTYDTTRVPPVPPVFQALNDAFSVGGC